MNLLDRTNFQLNMFCLVIHPSIELVDCQVSSMDYWTKQVQLKDLGFNTKYTCTTTCIQNTSPLNSMDIIFQRNS
jgi:hypothetical protein